MPKGVYPRESLTVRFWSKVNKDGPLPLGRPELGPCWMWTAAKEHRGYGIWRPTLKEKTNNAHRYSYVLEHGSIPDGLQIDHLCCNKSCVRPSHLEAVTGAVNKSRACAHITHCPQGHEYTIKNIRPGRNGARGCRICSRLATIRWKQKVGYSQVRGFRS